MSKEEIKKKLLDEQTFGPTVDEAFAAADTDKSGFIDRAELKTVLTEIAKGFGVPAPTEAEIDAELKRLDTNKDGKISKKEFRTFVKDLLMVMAESM